jgi:CRISPR/Cas system-associated endonuclease Cas1
VYSGLDPTCGYLHPDSLVYDLIEPFRAEVDKQVLTFFRLTTFHRGDFYQVLSGECRLNEQLRRYILASCRVSQVEIDACVAWLRKMLS